MKPTIEEVKKYFKDADLVRTEFGDEINIDVDKINPYGIHYAYNGIYTIWSCDLGYAKILTYKKPSFMPVAMKCSQEKFDAVKPKLDNSGLKIHNTSPFSEDEYLLNNFMGNLSIINLENCCKYKHDRIVYETWNEKVFLESCGIVVEEPKEENFVITKEQIRELYELTGFESKLNNKIKEWFPSAFIEDKKELVLEAGKWYNIQTKTTKYLLLYSDNKNELYAGFMDGLWGDTYLCSKGGNQKLAIEAAPEEVKSALEKEAVKRGYKKGTVIKDLYPGFSQKEIVASNKFDYELIPTKNNVWGLRDVDGNVLFCNGIWAEIIKPKQMTQSDIEK